MTWQQGGQELILRRVEPKVCTPEHLNTAAVIKETLITSAAVCLSLLSKREGGSRIATEGGDRGDIFMCNCLLGAKDAPGKESRIVTAFPMPSRQHGVRQKDTESPITGGDLISFKWTWLCFLWNKELITEAVFSNGSHVQSERVCSDVIQLIQTAHSQVSTTVAFFNFDPLTTTL